MPITSQIGSSSLIKPGVCTSTTRPATPYIGQFIFETDTLLTKYWSGSAWANNGVTSFTSSTGLSTNTSATGAVSVTNTGVTSAVAGTGVSVSGATGAVTLSIGQSVATSASPTFAGITASTGQIVAPAQYCYNGDNTAGTYTVYSGTPVIPPTTYFNIGSAFNTGNGRFTVPLAGYVLCSFNSLIQRNATNAAHAYVHFAVDGVRKSATTHTVYDIGGNYNSLNNTAIVYCPANSYVTAVLTTPQASAYSGEYGLGLTFRYLG